MKIIFLYTVNRSFLSSFFTQLAEECSNRGIDTLVWCVKRQSQHFRRNGVEFIIEKKDHKAGLVKKIYRLFRAQNPDIVVSNFSYANGALISGKLLGVTNSIVWMHTLTNQLDVKPSNILIKRWFLKLARNIIVNSPYLEKEIKEKYLVRNIPIHCLPFWTSLKSETKPIPASLDIRKVGCPGRLENSKNQEILIEWLYKVKESTKCELYFAGTGNNLEFLINKASDLGLDSRVHFLGVLGMEEMQEFYGKMDLIILPSRFESFGLVFIESLATNTPVLVSNAFGALTYVANPKFKKTYVFDPNDLNDLMDKWYYLNSCSEFEPYEFSDIYKQYFDKSVIIDQFFNVLSNQ